MRLISLSSLAIAFAFALFAPLTADAQVRQPPPVIERLEPTSGPPGTTVQMVGRYFRNEQAVLLGGRPVEVLTRLPNRWTFRIPAGASTGRIAIEVPGAVTTVGPEFRVLAAAPPPVISDLQPRSATPGSTVVILGENFSPRLTENLVTLGGLPVVVRSASPSQLVVTVPNGATTSRFVVRVASSGEATASFDLQVGTPVQIASFAPAVGAPGSTVTLTGTGFSSRRSGHQFFLGNTPLRVVSSTPTSAVVQLPGSAQTGLFRVEVLGVGRAFAATPFVVQAMPTIRRVDPPAGVPGSRIRITGTGFGTDLRVVQVLFGQVAGTVRSISNNELTVDVPQGAATGAVQVFVNSVGPASSPTVFDVLAPTSIADFQPRSGGPGSEFVITGSGFSPVVSNNRVTLGSAVCEVLAVTPTQLRVRVPQASSGPIVVEVVNAGVARSSQPFVVTTPPVIHRFEPQFAEVGAVVTIHGARFGNNPGLVEVSVGERRMQIRSISDSRIEAIVPPGATTERLRVVTRMQGATVSDRDLRIIAPLTVLNLDPTTAYPGQQITIRGTGFQSDVDVLFAGVNEPASYTVVSPTELRAFVPASAQSGNLTVRSREGRMASLPLTIVTPPTPLAITAVEATCLRPGCRVIVRGHGFVANRSGNTVVAGSARVTIRRATATYLEFDLPRSVRGTITLRVTVRGAGTVESEPLTITR